jgi:hypothetical protein
MQPFWKNRACKRIFPVDSSLSVGFSSQFLQQQRLFGLAGAIRDNIPPSLFLLPIFEEIECQNKLLSRSSIK